MYHIKLFLLNEFICYNSMYYQIRYKYNTGINYYSFYLICLQAHANFVFIKRQFSVTVQNPKNTI